MSKPVANGAAPGDGSLGGFESVDAILKVPGARISWRPQLQGASCAPPVPTAPAGLTLQEYIPADKLAHVQRVLNGCNLGKPVAALPLAPELVAAAEQASYDLQAYKFEAAAEQLRAPRIVRVALVQNSIKAPTTAPYIEQRQVCCGSGDAGYAPVHHQADYCCCASANCHSMVVTPSLRLPAGHL